MLPNENNITIVRTAPFEDCKKNPARVSPITGVIEINAVVFDYLPKEVQDFVIEHEKAHYLQQTKDETLADYYAMLSLFQKDKNALYNSVQAVEKLVPNDSERINSITVSALRIAALNGNKKAKELLGAKLNAIGEEKNSTTWFWLLIPLVLLTILIFKKYV